MGGKSLAKTHQAPNNNGSSQSCPANPSPPSPRYLSAATQPTYDLRALRRLLVILDPSAIAYRNVNSHGQGSTVERPGLSRFLQYLLTKHSVVIWTDSTKENITPVLDDIFFDWQTRLAAVQTREDFPGNAHPLFNVASALIIKDLSRVWELPEIQADAVKNNQGKAWDATNTVLIDDSITKAVSQPRNLIEVQAFNGVAQAGDMALDGVLRKVHWCSGFEDVRPLLRELKEKEQN